MFLVQNEHLQSGLSSRPQTHKFFAESQHLSFCGPS